MSSTGSQTQPSLCSLEDIGIAGTEYLKETLTNCSDPLAAIHEFQDQNGILLPSLKPALHFLDLHGISRLDFHQSVVNILKDALLQKVTECVTNLSEVQKTKKLNELLDKSFPLVKNSELQPIVLHVMKYLPKIKGEYLAVIEKDAELYATTSIEVKRQIWAQNQTLFGQEVSPLLTEYAYARRHLLSSPPGGSSDGNDSMPQVGTGAVGTFFAQSPRSRRQEAVVRRLVDMIGTDVYLYDMVLQFLRTLFVRTRSVHYCALRAELLMALHDGDVQAVCSLDPSHKFAWCLDACIRDGAVDAKRARELQGFLDGARRGQEEVLGDLAMVLCDPYAVHTVCLTVVKLLLQLQAAESLPRENQDLLLMMRLLQLGFNAWSMMDSQTFKEAPFDVELVVVHLPSLLSLTTCEQIRQVSLRLSGDSTGSGKVTNPGSPSFPPQIVVRSPTAAAVTTYFAVHASGLKDGGATFVSIVEALRDCDAAYEDALLHTLVNGWIQFADELGNRGTFADTFERFFLPKIAQDGVIHHAVRLLWSSYQRIPQVQADRLMKSLSPYACTHQDEELVSTFRSLTDRVASHHATVAAASAHPPERHSTIPFAPITGPVSP